MTQQLPPLTRRDVLRLGAASAAAAGVAGTTAATQAGATTSGPTDEADYVIIGSGPGGAPLAANLAAAGFSVIVLEAGPNQGNKTWYEVPAFANYAASEDATIRWDYFVQHYSDTGFNATSSQWVPGKGVLYPRSSGLGGCTTHHALITMAADPTDWSHLQNLTGDNSWAPDTMWGHWEKFLSWQPTEFGVTDVIRLDPMLGKIVNSAVTEASNLPGGADTTHPRSINDKAYVDNAPQGFFYTPQSSKLGHRHVVRERLLAARAANPSRLTIQTQALAERIVLETLPDGRKKAVAVEYLAGDHLYGASPRFTPTTAAQRAGRRRTVRARKEVIVAAGAFNSPQLLMLSGIGPKKHLMDRNLPVHIDLPGVGSNLQDRYEVSIVSDYLPFVLLQGCTFGTTAIDPCLLTWKSAGLLGASGFTPYNTNGVLGGIRAKYGNGARPEMFVFGTPADFRGYVPNFGPPGFTKDKFSWLVLKAYADARGGTVRLRSGDPTQTPVVNFRSFDDGLGGDRDLAAVVEGMQMIRRINGRLGSGHEIWPGPGVSTPEQLAAWVRKEAWGHHASCTNAIGAASDPMAVLDSKMRVRGTSNLRVVDASSFNRIPGFFIWGPIATIAEKASADILSGA